MAERVSECVCRWQLTATQKRHTLVSFILKEQDDDCDDRKKREIIIFYSSFKELCLSSHVGHGHCAHWAHLEILEMLQNLEWPSNGCFIRWAERSSERARPSSKSRWRPSSTICLVVAFQRQPRPMSGGKTSVTMLRLTTIIISTVQPWLLRLGSIYWR